MSLNQFPRRAFSGAATLQTFTGDGNTTTFTLSQTQTQNECFVFVEDVAQVPGVDFTINGTALTFTSAPANSTEIIVRGFGVPAPVTTVSDGSITDAKLATGAIEAKLGYTPVSPTQLSNEVAALVDSAPTTLNTLNELAAALGDDPNYATTITTALGTKANSSDVTIALSTKAPLESPQFTGPISSTNASDNVALDFYSPSNTIKKHDFALASSTDSKFTIDVAQGMGHANLSTGAYINSTGSGYKYVSTRGAARVALGDGELYLYTGNSNSGTANADVTFAAKNTFQNTTGTLYNGYISTAPTAYARFNGNTGSLLNSAGDYGSITRLAMGQYRFTFSRAMANANYMWYVNTDTNASRTGNHVGPASGQESYYFVYNTNYFQFTLAEYASMTRTDAEIVWVAIWEVI